MRILIVDDDHKNLKLLKAFVTDLGECEAVEGGQKAILAFKKAWEDWRPFSRILLDFLMPEMAGKQVLSNIRKIETDKKISDQNRVKIIMVTALSEKEMVFDCLRGGCDDFIVKPVDGTFLLKKIKKLGLMNSN